jgi:PAS domain S-box-containing protein
MVREADTTSLLADLADLPYFQVDADRNVVAISPAMERLTGFDAADVMGRSCLTLNRCPECLKGCGVFSDGAVHDVRLQLFRSDGTQVEVLKSGQVLRDESGAVTGAIEFVRPAAALSPERAGAGAVDTARLLSALGRLLIVADADFRVAAFNPALAEFVGVPPDRLPGMPLQALLGAELFGEGASLREAVAEGERREGWAGEVIRPDGTTRSVSLTVGAMPDTITCGVPEGRFVVMMRPETGSGPVSSFLGMVGRSPAMQRIFRLIELLRDNDSTVLITGESGTGKELVARALHTTSHRHGGPFVAVNCAAIPPELLESELFGHVRGAFTGAVKDRAGRFELADGGTLFLDEIGDLALPLQAKILRFLQERTLERVGDSRTRTVDVRIIAATHVNLVQAVSERRFREDLYYRLRVVPIHIPPIRERREDLELLIRHLLGRIGRQRGRSLRLAPSAGRALLTYPWPGNVRELDNALEYATTVCQGQTIHVDDLPREIGHVEHQDRSGTDGDEGPAHGTSRSQEESDPLSSGSGRMHEVRRIRAALEEARYKRAEAARILGMSRTTLWRKMREYGL